MSRQSQPVPVLGAWLLVLTPRPLWAQMGPGLLGQAALFPRSLGPQGTFSLAPCRPPGGTGWCRPWSRVGHAHGASALASGASGRAGSGERMPL